MRSSRPFHVVAQRPRKLDRHPVSDALDRERRWLLAGVERTDQPRVPADPLVRHGATDGGEDTELAALERGFGAPQLQHRGHVREQLAVPARRVDRECPPRVRIDPALDPDLIAVVDARGSGQRCLERYGQPVGGSVAANQAVEARGVVAVQQVQLHAEHLGAIGGQQLLEPGREPRPVERPNPRPVLVMAPQQRLVEVSAAGER